MLFFLPAATLGDVGCRSRRGKFLCAYVPFRSDMWENDQCMVFGVYLDIWTAVGNF